MNLLVIDFLNTVIRSVAVHQNLSFNEIHTGGLYGTINQLASILTKYRPEHIVLCKDSSPYQRKLDYPQYKQDRGKMMGNDFSLKIKTSTELVDLLFQMFKIPILSVPGSEADDLIATVVKKRRKDYDKVYILSNDDDLNQLLSFPEVVCLRKGQEYALSEFTADYGGVNPEDWSLITAMAGTHNAVRGIPRVGIKTAMKYYFDEEKLRQIYTQHKELIETNLKLIELPYKGIHCKLPKFEAPQVNESELIRYLEMYGIRYITRIAEAFYPYSNRNRTYD